MRRNIQANFQGNWADVYRKYAVNDPSHGMQFGEPVSLSSLVTLLLCPSEEFDRLAIDYSQGRLHFELADLHIIFNALDEHQYEILMEWLLLKV